MSGRCRHCSTETYGLLLCEMCQSKSDIRDLFDQWAKPRGWDIRRYHDHMDYEDADTQALWVGFRLGIETIMSEENSRLREILEL